MARVKSRGSTGPYSTEAERAAVGKAARRTAPRRGHATWDPGADRPDPLSVLEAQEESRVPELVPIRHGRMAASAFAFYRGAAAVMALDLAQRPNTGLTVQLCGDAHLANFGGFGAPDRDLVFDVNDFDETHPGPFEWDVQRLAVSFEVAGQDRDMTAAQREAAVRWVARSYRETMRTLAARRTLDIWYSRLDVAEIAARWGSQASATMVRNLERLAIKAESKDHLKAFNRLVHVEDGQLRFVSDPPLLVPVSEIMGDLDAQRAVETLQQTFDSYRASLSGDRRHLFDRYRFVDLARKVVGVGSVGTRCWVALLVGKDADDPLFLQVKEAEASVLEAVTEPTAYANYGERVVEGQRLVQAASDIMLGWTRSPGLDGKERDFYVRQLWDWKVSADLTTIRPSAFFVYAQMCGWTLARGHARSGDPIAIASYLGTGPVFDDAIVSFAHDYAEQNARDHEALVAAIRDGRLEATSGV
jgi:uncharacterized protein (DUF2252 family)